MSWHEQDLEEAGRELKASLEKLRRAWLRFGEAGLEWLRYLAWKIRRAIR